MQQIHEMELFTLFIIMIIVYSSLNETFVYI